MTGGNGPVASASDHCAAQVGASFDWVSSVEDGLCWLESQPLTGRTVVMRWRASSRECLATFGLPDASVGSSLHAYGGMPYADLRQGGMALVDGSTGHVVTAAGTTSGDYTYGDLDRYDDELFGVRETDHGDDLVVFGAGSQVPRVLRATSGFLASPRAHAGRVAWLQWEGEVMPWDSSELWVADYASGGQLLAPRRVAGGPAESVVQPCWGSGGWLYFMSDRSGWWNLHRWRDGCTEAVAPMAAECATAPWESSYTNFVFLSGDRIAMTVQAGPDQQLVVIEPDGTIRNVALPYLSIKPYLAAVGDQVALVGASPTRTSEVALVAMDGSDAVDVIRRGPAVPGDGSSVSVPEVLRVGSGVGEVVVVFYPATPAVADGSSPLIVRPHAGPTYHTELRLDREVQFFTSRGFAVADVDYRGSTGYGRDFRKALDGNWGRYDVEDCSNVAAHLIASGRARPGAVFISGASAGGYTALRAVSVDGPFALAVARSAIVDPHRWKTTAPRFQRPHAAILASATSRVDAEQVSRPVLLLHGMDDRVAPVDDVLALAAALEERGLLAGLMRFDGVGHYLSADAERSALDAELAAYRRVLRQAGITTSV
ncbi:prolyl oligopeptidase family serine peptidase [Dactylosporangium sp. NPDC051485]|uniref:S9 family peptidase n=1 Tax=Dactylosporangium sp. NPDC051485 TaxID=3154846 RepID=UPI00343990BC